MAGMPPPPTDPKEPLESRVFAPKRSAEHRPETANGPTVLALLLLAVAVAVILVIVL